jgi:hypothetical protein
MEVVVTDTKEPDRKSLKDRAKALLDELLEALGDLIPRPEPELVPVPAPGRGRRR